MKFKSYYWAIIAAAVLVVLAIAVPTLAFRGGGENVTNPHTPEELERLQAEAVDYTPQIEAYTDLINSNPNDAEAMAGLGDVYMSQGKYSEAADWYSKAIAAAPQEANYYGKLGEAYSGLGMMDVALREFEKGLQIDPNHQGILLDIGIIYSQTGRADQARQTWQRAYDLNPSSRFGHVAEQLLAGPEVSPGGTTQQP